MTNEKGLRKEIRKRTWKYFFEQKWEEISPVFIPIGIIIGTLILFFVLGLLTEFFIPGATLSICSMDLSNADCGFESCFDYFGWTMFLGMYSTLILLLVGLILYLIGRMFYSIWNWLKDNWEMASDRAIEELRRKKK